MRIAIITGASSGMGREFARQLPAWEKFDELWVIARRAERLEELKQELSVPVRPIALDLTDPEALARAMLKLRALAPLKIFGGCCGTDGRHLRTVARRIGGSRKGCASVEK